MLDVTVFVAKGLFKAFRLYFELLEKSLRLVDPNYKRPELIDRVVTVLFESKDATVDDRIKKIDAARENLQDAIAAIDELGRQAASNKNDLADALRRLDEAEQQKQEVGKELEALKQLAGADTAAFRRIVGIPSRADIWQERLLGFGSGVLASIIASIIFLLASKLLHIS